MIAKVRKYKYDEVLQQINELVNLIDGQNNLMIVNQMKNIIPEFISQNSIYEQLDKQLVK
jgi:hypothetical protein